MSKLEAYENRIESLEKMILELLGKADNKKRKEIFVLEKQMFKLRKNKMT